MTKRKDPAAVKLGRKGGRARTEAKAAAVRANGAKGGSKPSRLFQAAEGMLAAIATLNLQGGLLDAAVQELTLAVEHARRNAAYFREYRKRKAATA